jgi:hypothetical protein
MSALRWFRLRVRSTPVARRLTAERRVDGAGVPTSDKGVATGSDVVEGSAVDTISRTIPSNPRVGVTPLASMLNRFLNVSCAPPAGTLIVGVSNVVLPILLTSGRTHHLVRYSG